jgi:hypothetical protein
MGCDLATDTWPALVNSRSSPEASPPHEASAVAAATNGSIPTRCTSRTILLNTGESNWVVLSKRLARDKRFRRSSS